MNSNINSALKQPPEVYPITRLHSQWGKNPKKKCQQITRSPAWCTTAKSRLEIDNR